MANRSLFKKIAAVASAAAMLMGMSVNVFALDGDYDIGTVDGGTVSFYIECDREYDKSDAQTIVVSDYEADYLYAYVWLELYGVTGGGSFEFIDEKTDTDITGSETKAKADVILQGDGGLYFEFSATSFHNGFVEVEENGYSGGLSAAD